MDKYILCLQTPVACDVGLSKYKKQLIKIGHYVKESTGQVLDVTIDLLTHFVNEFNRYVGNGNKVSIPMGHERIGLPEYNQGWLREMSIQDGSLFGVMELQNPDLAQTNDVSICIEKEVTDGKGNKYSSIVTHVALTPTPLVPGLENFTVLSLSVGENNMEFLKKLAEKLGLKDATEDAVMLALDKRVEPKAEDNIKDSNSLVMLFSENRTNKLETLIKAGLLIPSVSEQIKVKYIDNVALEYERGIKDDFDFLCKVLMENRPVKLEAISGVQSLELSNPGVKPESPMRKVVNKKRADAGLKN